MQFIFGIAIFQRNRITITSHRVVCKRKISFACPFSNDPCPPAHEFPKTPIIVDKASRRRRLSKFGKKWHSNENQRSRRLKTETLYQPKRNTSARCCFIISADIATSGSMSYVRHLSNLVPPLSAFWENFRDLLTLPIDRYMGTIFRQICCTKL